MKQQFVRRVSALALAGCLLVGSSLPAFAAASTAKEEVIYANLTASGEVTGVYAVNSFAVQAGDTVTDHGSYTAVRNMTTSDAVSQSGDTVTVTQVVKPVSHGFGKSRRHMLYQYNRGIQFLWKKRNHTL